MASTPDDVRAALSPDELDYPTLAQRLGPASLPHLEQLIAGADPTLAPKAAYLVGLIGHPRAAAVLVAAARSGPATVRVAAAAADCNLPPDPAGTVLAQLVGDPDAGVRRVALRSAPARVSPELAAQIRAQSEREPDADLRALSGQVLQRPN